jgi:hypothetical protein
MFATSDSKPSWSRSFPDPLHDRCPRLVPHSVQMYTLAAECIERLSGQTYESFVENRILRPCGAHTATFETAAALLVRGYETDINGLKRPVNSQYRLRGRKEDGSGRGWGFDDERPRRSQCHPYPSWLLN